MNSTWRSSKSKVSFRPRPTDPCTAPEGGSGGRRAATPCSERHRLHLFGPLELSPHVSFRPTGGIPYTGPRNAFVCAGGGGWVVERHSYARPPTRLARRRRVSCAFRVWDSSRRSE